MGFSFGLVFKVVISWMCLRGCIRDCYVAFCVTLIFYLGLTCVWIPMFVGLQFWVYVLIAGLFRCLCMGVSVVRCLWVLGRVDLL